jgi:mono/diheme cytochrome c family protein
MTVRRWISCAGAFAALATCGALAHADSVAGKATFTSVCSECHDVADFGGENPGDLAANIKQIVAGTRKHKKALNLTDQQIADIAAYMAAGGK